MPMAGLEDTSLPLLLVAEGEEEEDNEQLDRETRMILPLLSIGTRCIILMRVDISGRSLRRTCGDGHGGPGLWAMRFGSIK